MPLKGDLSTFPKLKQRLGSLPRTIAQDVASRGAPVLTTLTTTAFGSNRTVYGDSRPMSAGGAPLTLRKTGTTERTLRFTSTGTIIRCVLGTKYARFLIGKYGILPNGGLPVVWRGALDRVVSETRVSL